jgi:formylmethanofuran dehydrogenase subunit C
MQVFDTPGSVSLQIKLPSGRVVVTAADKGRTSVELVPLGRRGADAIDGVAVTADEFQGKHVVRIEQKGIRWGPIQVTLGDEVEVRVACPPGTDLELSGAKAELRSTGKLGEVMIKTVSGNVRLESARRRLEVKTASGDIGVAAVEGEAGVVTVSGDIEVGHVAGSLTGRAVSGDVGIGSLDGQLSLSTTSGDVAVRAVEGGEVRVQTVSGDVRVGIGRGTRVWIDAASISGDLGSDLGIGDEEPVPDGAKPVVPVYVKTVSGDVSIVRAAEPVSA